MVEWHHRLNGYEFEQTLGDSEGPGSLGSCSPWGHEEPDMTERLNSNNNNNNKVRFVLLLLSRFSRVRLCVTP